MKTFFALLLAASALSSYPVHSSPLAPPPPPPPVEIAAAAAVAGIGIGQPGAGSRLDRNPNLARVLFLGNSYTYFNSLPVMFENVSRALGAGTSAVNVNATMLAPGGSSLFDHANLSLPMGADTADALGDPRGWDYVVLQDQSEVPGGGKDTDAGLAPFEGRNRSLSALKQFFRPRIAAAGAVPVLYSTWGRHDGDAPNAECCGYGDFLSMTALTTEGYQLYAAAVNAGTGASPLVAPAGIAFEAVFNKSGTDPLANTSRFSCLYNHGEEQEGQRTVSDSGVCVLNGAGLGGHPSVEGSYLISMVLAETIFQQSVEGLEWAPSGVSPSTATFLQTIAHSVVGAAADAQN